MRHRIRAAAVGAVLAALTVQGVHAQRAPGAITVSGGLAGGQSIQVRAERPAFVTVFAVGRNALGSPLIVLADESGASRARRRVQTRRLRPSELLRLAGTSEVVVVALASGTRPDLSAFSVDGHFAGDLVLSDSATADGRRLISALAEALYPRDVQYAARLLPVDLETSAASSDATYATNACGERVMTAAPTQGQPVSNNGAVLPGASDGRAFNPSFSAAPLSLTPGPPTTQDRATYGEYVVSRLQLPGCTVLQYAPVPTPARTVPPTPPRTVPPAP